MRKVTNGLVGGCSDFLMDLLNPTVVEVKWD